MRHLPGGFWLLEGGEVKLKLTMKKTQTKHKQTKNTIYQIDQSGKIEQTSLDTVIAFSNGKKYTILLDKTTKRSLQRIFKDFGKPEMFVYQTFATILAIIFKEVKPASKVIIDIEYPGKENLIAVLINEVFERFSWKKDFYFEFGRVGKSSPADHLAALVARKKSKPDKILGLEEIVNLLWPRKKTGYSSISGTKGNLTQDWLPGDRKPSQPLTKKCYHRKAKKSI